MGSFKIGKVVLQSMFKKPATLMYPVVQRTWQERTRGHIGIEEASCILCSICDKKCPTDAIHVDRNKRIWEIERMLCIQCGCCVEVCPKKCLHMNQEYTAPDAEKIVDTVSVPEQPKPAKPAAPKAAAPKPEVAKPAASKEADAPAEKAVNIEKPAPEAEASATTPETTGDKN